MCDVYDQWDQWNYQLKNLESVIQISTETPVIIVIKNQSSLPIFRHKKLLDGITTATINGLVGKKKMLQETVDLPIKYLGVLQNLPST